MIQGIIENKEIKVAKNKNQYAIFTIAGKKLSTFNAEWINDFKQGDSVEIETEQKGEYESLKSIKKTQPVASLPQFHISADTHLIVEQLKRIADKLEEGFEIKNAATKTGQ
jgi:hypothetical protein